MFALEFLFMFCALYYNIFCSFLWKFQFSNTEISKVNVFKKVCPSPQLFHTYGFRSGVFLSILGFFSITRWQRRLLVRLLVGLLVRLLVKLADFGSRIIFKISSVNKRTVWTRSMVDIITITVTVIGYKYAHNTYIMHWTSSKLSNNSLKKTIVWMCQWITLERATRTL